MLRPKASIPGLKFKKGYPTQFLILGVWGEGGKLVS